MPHSVPQVKSSAGRYLSLTAVLSSEGSVDSVITQAVGVRPISVDEPAWHTLGTDFHPFENEAAAW